MDESLGGPEESKTPNADLIIALTDPFEKNVQIAQALFKNLGEEKYWVSKQEKFLVDSLRDVLEPLGWDIVRRPPGARRRPTSAEKTLKKILRTKLPKRRKSGR